MAKFWKIHATTARMGAGQPMREFYVVAVGNTPAEALEALRIRKKLDNAQLEVTGEIAPSTAADFAIKSGDILCVWAI
jgi:hypothetical protein